MSLPVISWGKKIIYSLKTSAGAIKPNKMIYTVRCIILNALLLNACQSVLVCLLLTFCHSIFNFLEIWLSYNVQLKCSDLLNHFFKYLSNDKAHRGEFYKYSLISRGHKYLLIFFFLKLIAYSTVIIKTVRGILILYYWFNGCDMWESQRVKFL